MKVTLIEFTGSGHPDPAKYAMAILAFTKSTRLQMSPGLFGEIMGRSAEELEADIKYAANTIPSSWEMVDYTFLIEGVTRAFTHQLVRTRTASYAQQAMRILNVSEGKGWSYDTGPTIAADKALNAVYGNAMDEINEAYKKLVENGAKVEDARGLLPTNILTNIVMKLNMRNWVDLVRKRSSLRVQDEYRAVVEGMKDEVRRVHPWIDHFISRDFDNAASELANEIAALPDKEQSTKLLKLLDIIRTTQK